MKKVANLTKFGTGNTQVFYEHLVDTINANLVEAAAVLGLTVEEADTGWTASTTADSDASAS